MVLAHETWFTTLRPPYDWSFAAQPATLILLALAVVVTIGWRRLPLRSQELPWLHPLARLE